VPCEEDIKISATYGGISIMR